MIVVRCSVLFKVFRLLLVEIECLLSRADCGVVFCCVIGRRCLQFVDCWLLLAAYW